LPDLLLNAAIGFDNPVTLLNNPGNETLLPSNVTSFAATYGLNVADYNGEFVAH